MTTQRPRLLVTGAGGHLGRRVVELLLDAGADVIATSRDPSKLADLAARGAEVRRADFDDVASLDTAFAGADRLLLVSTDALGAPGLRITQHRAAVAAAERAGVRHIAYTSAPSPRPEAAGGVIDDHFWTEQAIAATGLDWTFLRHALYADLVLMSGPQAIASGRLFSATGEGGRSYVTREDCARADAGALLTAAGREILDVTGPAAITQDELAALLSEVSGKPVAHTALDAASLKAGLLAAGLPPFMADVLVTFDVEASQGYHAVVTDAVQRLGGVAPTSLRGFLEANRAALAA
jgi:NAD(P)H dehydrogenase (quinone)